MEQQSVSARLGLNIPYEWWPSTPIVKEIEAAGFSWIQLPSPPASILTDPRDCVRHATFLARALATSSVRRVLHAPTSLRVGDRDSDAVLAGALSYAAECGAEQVIYHALAVEPGPGADEFARREIDSLSRLAVTAERLGIVIAIENLAPLFPGPQLTSAIPQTLKALASKLDSPAVRLCLDVGHANVIAGLRRTRLTDLVDPVLASVSIFHIHDNLGGRLGLGAGDEVPPPQLDPLKLDLHLPPGRGSLPWPEVAPHLLGHEADAPIMLEVHPPHRPSPGELFELTLETIQGHGRTVQV